MQAYKLAGQSNGKHIVEFEDGRREVLTDAELAILTGAPEGSLDSVDALIEIEVQRRLKDENNLLVSKTAYDDLVKTSGEAQAKVVELTTQVEGLTTARDNLANQVTTLAAENSSLQDALQASTSKAVETAPKPAVTGDPTPIDKAVGVPPEIIEALKNAGLATFEAVRAATDADLKAIPKLGQGMLAKVRAATAAPAQES